MSSSSASMTDLMFLLLIFLMIATTLINSNALKLTLPKSTSPNKDKSLVVVSIAPDLQIYVDDAVVPAFSLEAVLQQRLRGVEEPKIILRADEKVPVGEVVKVMNIAKNNNFQMNLATSPE